VGKLLLLAPTSTKRRAGRRESILPLAKHVATLGDQTGSVKNPIDMPQHALAT
jgi:hypothetical protein